MVAASNEYQVRYETMRLWNWIIGKGKKRRYASWLILSGLFLIPSGLIWVIGYGIDNTIAEVAEWIIAIVICWTAWRFIVFLLNIRGRSKI